MSRIILGSDLAQEQPATFGYSPTSGYFTTRKWRCAKKPPLEAITAGLTGWQWQIDEGFGVFTLTATLSALDSGGGGGTEQPITTWELLSNSIEKNILEATITPLGGAQLSADDVKEIEQALDGNEKDLDFLFARGPVVYEVFLLMQKGTRSVLVDTPVLHRSQLVSKNYQVKSSFEDSGKILKTSTLKTKEAIPDAIMFELPDDTSPADVLFPDGGPVPGFPKSPRLRYGWRKNSPTAQLVSFNKYQLSQTWSYGLWSKLMYGEPI